MTHPIAASKEVKVLRKRIKEIGVQISAWNEERQRLQSLMTKANAEIRKLKDRMATIMVRSAPNDFDAMLTAQGMENAGATVISISYNGQRQPVGAMIPSSKFVVWARVPDGINIDDVDAAIEKELDK